MVRKVGGRGNQPKWNMYENAMRKPAMLYANNKKLQKGSN